MRAAFATQQQQQQGGLRLTGCALSLHGGASVAWEQRSHKLPATAAAAAPDSSTDASGTDTAAAVSPSSSADTSDEEAATTVVEVTTETGGGGAYEWLDGGLGGSGDEELGSWVALPMRWHREGFPVGVLFVRLTGEGKGEETFMYWTAP